MRLAALVGLLAAGAAGAGQEIQLYPVRGVFFPAQGEGARIDADFRAAIGDAELGYFAKGFRARFPAAATTISEATQRRTYAVSLQVARASRFTVAKTNGTVDVYLPVTASLYFTNVMTGEVLYAATRTIIKTATMLPKEAVGGGERAVSLFGDTFREVVDDLVGDAAVHFKPRTISAKLLKEWKGLAILDLGQEGGLAREDLLLDEGGNELRVLHVAPRYAVAAVSLGALVKGATYSRVSNGTLSEIRKPRVLPIVELAPAGFPDEALVQLFSDALGASAPVSLVPVNRTYAAVLRALATQLDLTKEKLSQRELPAFFVRLHVPDPVSYERSTNLSYQTLRVTEALAYAEVVDRAGRVLYAAVGRDRTEDEITQGMALGLEARKEIAVKNALLALAKRFGAEFKLESARLQVAEAGPRLSAKDEHGVLATGAAVRAYRSVDGVPGVTGEVLVPIWELEVTVPGEETTELSPVLPVMNEAPAPEKGDVLIVEGASGTDARRRRFGACGEADQRGALGLPDYTSLAFNLFASGYRVPFYARGLGPRVEALVHGGTGFKESLAFPEPKVDYCVQPVYKIVPQPEECSEKVCAEVATVKCGYRIRLGTTDGEVKGGGAMESRMTAGALPRSASSEAKAAALRADLLDEVLKLAPAAAAGLAKEKL